MNHVKNRMQALGLLDRSFKAASDAELTAVVESLDDDHREGLEAFVDGDLDVDALRAGIRTGRVDGSMEAIASILTDACLADCIEQLGDHAENPTSEQLRDVIPGLIERHGLPSTRIMLAATVAGEAPASPVIRDLLKYDDEIALPKMEEPVIAPAIDTSKRSAEEQAAVRAKRAEAKLAKKQAERARKAQSAAARRR